MLFGTEQKSNNKKAFNLGKMDMEMEIRLWGKRDSGNSHISNHTKLICILKECRIKLRKYEMNTISAVKSRWCEIYIILIGILYTCKQITLKETKKNNI